MVDTEWGLYAGTHADGVFRLDPATRQWEALGLDHAIVSSLLFQPDSQKRLLAGLMPYADEQTEAAVFASEDAGQNWKPWDGGLAASRDNRGWAYGLGIDPGNPRRLYMAYFDQMARSEDGGRTWQLVYGAERSPGGGCFCSIVVSASRDGTVWAAGENSILQGRLLRTRDWGDTWENVPVDPRAGTPVYEDNGVLSLAVAPAEPSRLFAGMQSGFLVRSSDAGSTWQPVFRAADISAFLQGVIFVGEDLYVAASENFRPPPGGNGSPLTDLGLYRSRTMGATWDTIPVPELVRGGGQALALDRLGRLLIATRESGVWRFENRD